MASTATAEAISSRSHIQTESAHEPDDMESNHDLPARTMADDEHEQSDLQTEDPATTAASEELRQTTISDTIANHSRAEPVEADSDSAETKDKDMGGTVKASTPEPVIKDAQDEEMKGLLSPPKKKRGRDDQDEEAALEQSPEKDETSSADGTATNGKRTRSEPEKKRARDKEASKDATGDLEVKLPRETSKTSATEPPKDTPESTAVKSSEDKPKTSSAKFESSGFAKLAATQTSGFGAIASSTKSVFGGGAPAATSDFGAFGSAKPAGTISQTTTSGFGALASDEPSSGFSFGGTSGASSGFGGAASGGFGGIGSASGSVFGQKLGNGFGGGSGKTLSSFAAPGSADTLAPAKPAKAFGAPESDEEDGSDEDDSEGEGGDDEDDASNTSPEEKKKSKTARVPIDDGEAGEVTLLQMRAKLFAIESKETGWKERGVGTLKVNVPKSCAEIDEFSGLPISGSFDPSGLDEEEAKSGTPRVPRLIMRQENTHRVILNTVIIRGMEFQDKPSATAAQILFTAFEGVENEKGIAEPKPINMLLKLSEANARLFRSEIDSIQREL